MSRFQATLLLMIVPFMRLSAFGDDPPIAQLQQWVAGHNVAAIRAPGRPVLPKLVRLYEASREDGFKARVAQTLYELSCSDFEGVSSSLNDGPGRETAVRG